MPELRQSWDAEALNHARVGLRQPLAQGREARKRRDAMIGTVKLIRDGLGELNDVRAEEARAAPLLRRAARVARKLRNKKPFWHR